MPSLQMEKSNESWLELKTTLNQRAEFKPPNDPQVSSLPVKTDHYTHRKLNEQITIPHNIIHAPFLTSRRSSSQHEPASQIPPKLHNLCAAWHAKGHHSSTAKTCSQLSEDRSTPSRRPMTTPATRTLWGGGILSHPRHGINNDASKCFLKLSIIQ